MCIDDRGYIVTNNHVIADAEAVEIVWLDGTTMEAEIVGTDPSTDIAVLKFEGSVDAQPVPLGDSDALHWRVGHRHRQPRHGCARCSMAR